MVNDLFARPLVNHKHKSTSASYYLNIFSTQTELSTSIAQPANGGAQPSNENCAREQSKCCPTEASHFTWIIFTFLVTLKNSELLFVSDNKYHQEGLTRLG